MSDRPIRISCTLMGDILWQADPHTFVKHAILKSYLGTWFAKLGQTHGRVVFIDGFAGPGEYPQGQPGSPIVALDTALTHRATLTGELVFLFVELDPKRAAHLEGLIGQRQLPSNFKCMVVNSDFASTVTEILDGVAAKGGGLAPSFVMIDPFGWTGLPWQLIKRIANYPRTEVLVSLMYEGHNRFLTHPDQSKNMDELFGTPEWRDASSKTSARDRREFLVELYRRQLQAAGFVYTYAFELRDSQNKAEYFLVHGTQHLDGLDGIKRAMWSADPSGQFAFSDYEDAKRSNQMTLIGNEPNFEDLRQRLISAYRTAGWIDVNVAVKKWLLTETPYHDGHLRQKTLAPMEKDGLIEVRRPDGKTRSYWNTGTSIRIVNS